MSVVPGLQGQTDLAINSKGEMIVSQKEYVTVIDKTNFTVLNMDPRTAPKSFDESPKWSCC